MDQNQAKNFFNDSDKKHDISDIKRKSEKSRYEELLKEHYKKDEPEQHSAIYTFFEGIIAWIMDSVQVIIIALATIIISYLFLVSPHAIEGPSMQPNFCNGDLILADKLTPRFNSYKVGDVIVFRHDVYDDYIKRIVAVGGDTIKVKDGKVYRNGELINEDYLPKGRETTIIFGDKLSENQEYQVPEGKYFVLGDNRPESSDSRRFLAIDPEANVIKGRVLAVMWPPQRARIFDDHAVRPIGECIVK